MIKKIYLIIKLSIFIGVLTTFIGCEMDLYEEAVQNKNKSGIIEKRINLDSFHEKYKIFNELKDSYQKIKALQNNTNSRIIIDTENGFKIETNDVLYLQYGSLYSLTFPIYRDIPMTKLQNLVICKLSDGTFTKKIVEYDLTPQEKIDLSNNYLKSITNPVQTQNLGSLMQSCITVTQVVVIPCGSGEHDSSNIELWGECQDYNKPRFATVAFDICNSLADENGNTGGDNSIPGWFGDGFGEISNNPISLPLNYPTENTNPEEYEDGISQPVEPSESINEDDAINNPCDELKKLFETDSIPNKSPNLKPQIENLITQLNSGINFEVGYEFSKNSSSDYSCSSLISSPNTINSLNLQTGGDIYGGAHIHTPRLFSIYTWSDVYKLFEFYKNVNSSNKSEVTFLLASKYCYSCADVYVYALKIKDFAAFRNKINADMNNPNTFGFNQQQKVDYADDKFFQKLALNMTQQKLEQVFLEHFENYNISLYKLDENYENWNELTLSSNPLQTITETPCN